MFLVNSSSLGLTRRCKKLFRKVGDRSSDFYPDINEVRRDGSYIYEEFIETQGTDVKMCKFGGTISSLISIVFKCSQL